MVPPRIDLPPTRLTISLISLDHIMSYDDQKRIDRLIHLAYAKFKGTIRENANEFLINCQERMHNLRSIKSHGVYYMSY